MKNILLAFLFIFGIAPVFAQFHIGLSAGANQSFYKWEIKHPAIAWRAVLLCEWQLEPWIGIRAETGMNNKAYKRTSYLIFESDLLAGNFKGSQWEFHRSFQYWESSLLVQINPVKRFRYVYLLAGGSYGWLQGGWLKTEGYESGVKHNSQRPIEVKDNYWNRNSLAADFGIGGNIPLGGHSKLKIEGRFQKSLPDLGNSNDVDAQTNSLLFNLGYMHRL